MKLVPVWLAVMATAFHGSQAQCADRDIRVTGIHTANLVVGRLEICTAGEWRAVCQSRWDANVAAVACRQLGFPSSEGTLFCRNSCFGKTEQPGLFNFDCNGGETELQQCFPLENENCGQAAGVVCKSCATITMVTEAMETENATATEGGVRADLVRESCLSPAALGGGLGALTAILAILLVGVVLGWVWSCHRKSGLQERELTSPGGPIFHNPTYSPISSNHTPPIQYSSVGPRGSHHCSSHPSDKATPVSKKHEPPPTQGEAVHHVLEEKEYQEVAKERAEEGLMPISISRARPHPDSS